MELESAGAVVIAGNTDIAVADGDYAAAFPWLDEVPVGHRAAAEWARERLSDDQLDYLRRLPVERRLPVGEEIILACHASPGSQTSGMPADLDATTTMQYVTRTDARVICCGHTHVADVREIGRKLLVNPGSCGYAFDGSPEACWAMLTFDEDAEPEARLFRTAYDAQSVAEEVNGRGLPSDVYRAATIRTGRFVR
jgi:predicted phosphodiesterase